MISEEKPIIPAEVIGIDTFSCLNDIDLAFDRNDIKAFVTPYYFMSDVEIHRTADLKKLRKPIIVLGFPGTGLVGSVAASQIVESLQMEFGGYISSSDFAPLAAIHDYKPMPAARLHYSEKHNMIVLISEMTIPISSSLEVSDKIFEFAKSVDASTIVSLGGISLKEEKGEVYVISSDQKAVRDIIAKKIAKPIREGATTGVTGLLLTKGTLENFAVTTILAESSEEYLDPKAAASVIRVLTRIIGVPINTSGLEKEAKELSKTLKEAVIKARLSKRKGPSAEEGGSMFG